MAFNKDSPGGNEEFEQDYASLTDDERVEWDLLVSNNVTEERAMQLLRPVVTIDRSEAMLSSVFGERVTLTVDGINICRRVSLGYTDVTVTFRGRLVAQAPIQTSDEEAS